MANQKTSFVAFVVGNSHYDDALAFASLPHATTDATEVFETLTSGATSIFDATRSIFRQNLGRDALKAELNAFFDCVESDDTLLFYFAGHGKSFAQKHFALVMTDTKPANLAGTGFDPTDLSVFLDERQIRRSILIVDCCRAGKLLERARARGPELEGEINVEPLSGAGRWFVASCRAYENSKELDSLEHGVFTHYFVEGLRTGNAASTEHEFIDVQRACSFASFQIRDQHKDLAQTPICEGFDLSGDPVYLARNPAFKKKAGLEKFTLAVMRNLEIFDQPDEVRMEIILKRRLADFLTLVPAQEVDVRWKQAFWLYGQALGFSDEALDAQLAEHEAVIRFEAPLPTERIVKGLAGLFSVGPRGHAFSMPEGSIFGRELVEALSGKAADSNGVVTLNRAFEYVRTHMRTQLEKLNIEQSPLLVADGNIGELILTGGRDSPAGQGKRCALLVATDKYHSHEIHSSNSEPMIRETARVLGELGQFDVRVLLDIDATEANMRRELNRLAEETGPSDCALFYFSGHAAIADRNLHLIAADTDYRHGGLPIDYLLGPLRGGGRFSAPEARAAVVILDTSYAGAAQLALLKPM